MKDAVRVAYLTELTAASVASASGDAKAAFHHLERAHVLGQRHTWRHVRVHWLMLKWGLSSRNGREVRGQLTRIVAAALFSRIWVPIGNTGGANVSAIQPMSIPDDLRALLEP